MRKKCFSRRLRLAIAETDRRVEFRREFRSSRAKYRARACACLAYDVITIFCIIMSTRRFAQASDTRVSLARTKYRSRYLAAGGIYPVVLSHPLNAFLSHSLSPSSSSDRFTREIISSKLSRSSVKKRPVKFPPSRHVSVKKSCAPG